MKKVKGKTLTKEEVMELEMNATYQKRFELLMRLIRIDKMLKNAKIIPAQNKPSDNG